MQKKKVEPTFGSIFRAVEEKTKKVSFLQSTATQITLNGNLDNLPLICEDRRRNAGGSSLRVHQRSFLYRCRC